MARVFGESANEACCVTCPVNRMVSRKWRKKRSLMLEEKVLWDGDSQTITAKATSGRVAEHYSLTTEHLSIQTGILSRQAHQIRLADIADVDLKQSLAQRAMGTGDITLTVEREHGAPEKLTLSSVPEPRKIRDMIGSAIVDARQRHLETTRYVYESPAQASIQPPPANDADVVAKLEGLKRLRDSGVISAAEFEAKKAELLSQL